jgi:hypothetical protein
MQTNQEGKYDFGLMKRKKDWYFVNLDGKSGRNSVILSVVCLFIYLLVSILCELVCLFQNLCAWLQIGIV